MNLRYSVGRKTSIHRPAPGKSLWASEGLLRRVGPPDPSLACNRPLTRPAPAGESAGSGTPPPQGRGQRTNYLRLTKGPAGATK